jgi:hypothetical protein
MRYGKDWVHNPYALGPKLKTATKEALQVCSQYVDFIAWQVVDSGNSVDDERIEKPLLIMKPDLIRWRASIVTMYTKPNDYGPVGMDWSNNRCVKRDTFAGRGLPGVE